MNKDQPKTRQITLPHSDYQPNKAEKEKEYAMPGADAGTTHRAFFQPTDIRHKAKGK